MITIVFSVPNHYRNQWMDVILSSYSSHVDFPDSKVVVCDLHFAAQDITICGNRKLLVRGAIPKILYV